MAERRITVGDGKYTFVRGEHGELMACLRYGEDWPAAFHNLAHSNAACALLDEIERLRAEVLDYRILLATADGDTAAADELIRRRDVLTGHG